MLIAAAVPLACALQAVGAPAPSVQQQQVRSGASAVAPAQPHPKFWVYFKDKGIDSPSARDRAIDNVRQSYNPRAIERRAKRGSAARRSGALFDERDLPVHGAYVAGVQQLGAEIVHESRWLNAVSVRAGPAQLDRISALPFVDRVEPVRGARRREAAPQPQQTAGIVAGVDPFYGSSFDQLELTKLPELHAQGFTGAGLIIGVLDTGFLRSHAAFNDPQHPINVIAEYDFVDNDANTSVEAGDPTSQHRHGTWVLGTIGAYKPGELVGGAYDASFVLCKTEDTTQEVPIEEDNYEAGLEFIEANGGDIATSSLGYPDFYTYADLDGQTAVTTQAVNVATQLGVICLTAVGNGGQNQANPTLIPPSDAFDVISVGAVGYSGQLASFSSNGPTADGRLKPEVLALGEGAFSVSSTDDIGYASGLNGTSFSTPLAAAAVACILQAHPIWSIAQIRQNLFETAGDFRANGEPDPTFERGYGIIDAYQAAQDCNANGLADLIDIRQGASDANHNNIPDICEPPGPIPATSEWGLVILTLSLAVAGTLRMLKATAAAI